MTKRARLDIIKDILNIISYSHNIKSTPLMRKSGLSSSRFKEYYLELLERGLIKESLNKNKKIISLTEKGVKFLDRYKSIIEFIEEFEL